MRKQLPSMKKVPSVINTQGFSLVEVMLAVSVFAILAIAFSSSFIYGIDAVASGGNRVRASMLANEGLEAVRNIRDENFGALIDGIHGLTTSLGEWVFSGTEDTQGIFTRTVTVSSINEKRKNIVSRVSWQQGTRVSSVSTVTRLTDWDSVVENGTITVHKNVINTFGTKTAQDFAPYTVGSTTVNIDTATPFAPGTYTVSETVDPLYTETFGGDCNMNGEITIDYEEAKTCTITNQEI